MPIARAAHDGARIESISNPDPVPTRIPIRQSLPLVLAAVALLAGAWVASVGHLRLLGSVYPLWMILALNGVIAGIAGTASVLVRDADRSAGNAADVVEVPRIEWAALLRRAEAADQRIQPVAWVASAPALSELHGGFSQGATTAHSPSSHLLSASLDHPPDLPPLHPDASALRREMELLELQGIAEAAVSTGENLGGEELLNLLDASADDLIRISKLLGAPRRLGESPPSMMIRLLRLVSIMSGLPQGRFTPADTERLADKLSAMIADPGRSRRYRRSGKDVEAAADELEALVRELEPDRSPSKRKEVV